MKIHRILAWIDNFITPDWEAALFLGLVLSGLLGMKLIFAVLAVAYFLGSGFAQRLYGLIQDKQDVG